MYRRYMNSCIYIYIWPDAAGTCLLKPRFSPETTWGEIFQFFAGPGQAWIGSVRPGSARLELKHCLSISMSVYVAPHGPRPWVAKFGPGPIESLSMMLGHFVDSSVQFVGNPKRNKFPPRHVVSTWRGAPGNCLAPAIFPLPILFVGRHTMHPTNPSNQENIQPNRKPEATLQGGNILLISAFYQIGSIAPSLGGAGCLSMPQFLVVLSLRKPMRLGVTIAYVDILVCVHFQSMRCAGQWGGGDGRTKR